MSKLGRRRLVRVALETTAGTAESPTTQLILAYDPVINRENTFQERQYASQYGGRQAGQMAEPTGTCSFRTELRSDGTDALDAGLAMLLNACGMKLTGSVFAPRTDIPSADCTVTLDVFEDGVRKRIHGAAGTFTLTGEAGKAVFVEFEFSGIWAAPVDEALPADTPGTRKAMRLADATFSIGSGFPKVSNFSLTANNVVEQRQDISAAAAIERYIVADRDITIGVDPEHAAVATHDIFGLLEGETEVAASLELSDGDVDLTIAAPKAQYREVSEGTRDSKAIHDVTLQCNMDSGDDEVTLTTAATL